MQSDLHMQPETLAAHLTLSSKRHRGLAQRTLYISFTIVSSNFQFLRVDLHTQPVLKFIKR